MSPATSRSQEEVNRAVYYNPGAFRPYLSRLLTMPEAACLLKYQPHISGRDVLDIGVGAGRTARYLAPLARRYVGVDYSPVMVAYVRQTQPTLAIHQASFQDLSMFGEASFDFIFATDNVIDTLAHQDRLSALREAARVLRPGGVLAFSSHNLRYRRARSVPWLDWSWDPVRLARNGAKYAVSWWNYLRVGRLRRITAEYALLNDRGHLYACLHYYTVRSMVRDQLAVAGLRLVEAFDGDGQPLAESEGDEQFPSLLYVARAP